MTKKEMSDFWRITYSFFLTSILGTALIMSVNGITQRRENERIKQENKEKIFIEHIVPFLGIMDNRLAQLRSLCDSYYTSDSIERGLYLKEYEDSKDEWVRSTTQYSTLISLYFGDDFNSWIGNPFIKQTVHLVPLSEAEITESLTFISLFFEIEQKLKQIDKVTGELQRIDVEDYNDLLADISEVKCMIMFFASELRGRLEGKPTYRIIVEDF